MYLEYPKCVKHSPKETKKDATNSKIETKAH